MDWNNPWVVGIGTGILSGALVGWITHSILARGENKEHRQKVGAANRDVIYAIRPGISEGEIPTREVVLALIAATARQFDISPQDLFEPPQLAEELIKEVMDSSFLSSKQKSEYCIRLAPLREVAMPRAVVPAEEMAREAVAAYRDRLSWMLSITLGMSTSLMTAILSASRLRAEYDKSDWHIISFFGPFGPFLVPVLFSISVLTLAQLIFRRLRESRK